jgi:hypothetical protein
MIKFRRLDTVSRVTIHIFIGEVALAALAASLADNFATTFGFVLLVLATLQLFARLASHPPRRRGLSEIDGALWLVALSICIHVF